MGPLKIAAIRNDQICSKRLLQWSNLLHSKRRHNCTFAERTIFWNSAHLVEDFLGLILTCLTWTHLTLYVPQIFQRLRIAEFLTGRNVIKNIGTIQVHLNLNWRGKLHTQNGPCSGCLLCLPRFRMSPMKGNNIFKQVCHPKNKPTFSSNTSSLSSPKSSKSSTHHAKKSLGLSCLNIQSCIQHPPKNLSPTTWTGTRTNSRADSRRRALQLFTAQGRGCNGCWATGQIHHWMPTVQQQLRQVAAWTGLIFWGGIGYPGPWN